MHKGDFPRNLRVAAHGNLPHKAASREETTALQSKTQLLNTDDKISDQSKFIQLLCPVKDGGFFL